MVAVSLWRSNHCTARMMGAGPLAETITIKPDAGAENWSCRELLTNTTPIQARLASRFGELLLLVALRPPGFAAFDAAIPAPLGEGFGRATSGGYNACVPVPGTERYDAPTLSVRPF
jgi:hypothetical protein